MGSPLYTPNSRSRSQSEASLSDHTGSSISRSCVHPPVFNLAGLAVVDRFSEHRASARHRTSAGVALHSTASAGGHGRARAHSRAGAHSGLDEM